MKLTPRMLPSLAAGLVVMLAACAPDEDSYSQRSEDEAESSAAEDAELGAASDLNAQAAASGTVPGQKIVDCDSWNGVVDGRVKFAKPCVFRGQVKFASAYSVLNCAGGALDGKGLKRDVFLSQGQGVGVLPKKAVCEKTGNTVMDPDVSGSKIFNCTIRNFGPGIYFKRRVWKKNGDVCKALTEASHNNQLDPYLGGTESRDKLYAFHPKNITIENVKVYGNSANGIFVGEFGQGYKISKSLIYNNKSRGIYLERESRNNKITHNTIRDNKAEGIAVDASAYNQIVYNTIKNNRSAGITLFRNCGETHDGKGVVRVQHASNNTIMHNFIAEHRTEPTAKMIDRKAFDSLGVGIYVAGKQGMQPDKTEKMGCLNEPRIVTYKGTLYDDVQLDYSRHNKIANNIFKNNAFAHISVHDDYNEIVGNTFRGRAAHEVLIGSLARMLIGEPVRGTIIKLNKSESTLNAKKELFRFVFGSTRADNPTDCNSRINRHGRHTFASGCK